MQSAKSKGKHSVVRNLRLNISFLHTGLHIITSEAWKKVLPLTWVSYSATISLSFRNFAGDVMAEFLGDRTTCSRRVKQFLLGLKQTLNQ